MKQLYLPTAMIPLIFNPPLTLAEGKTPFDCASALKAADVLKDSVAKLRDTLLGNKAIGNRAGDYESGFRHSSGSYTIPAIEKALSSISEAYGEEIKQLAKNGCELPK